MSRSNPFGTHWKEKNRIEAYLRAIFINVDNEDGLGLKELFEELDQDQLLYLWRLLASDTRKKIKELTREDL